MGKGIGGKFAMSLWPCPVSERLAKRLSRKNFRFIRISWTAPKRKIFA